MSVSRSASSAPSPGPRRCAAIESAAGIDAVDIYGLSEDGPGVANECIEAKDGPVIWEDHFYPEIIDPDTGEVLPDGAEGELVFTTLTKEALPVVRYRTRDLTRLAAAHRAQHAPHRQDRRPQRRHADHPRRQRVPRRSRSWSGHGLSGQYQLVITRNGHLDQLTVRCELRRSTARPTPASARAGRVAAAPHQDAGRRERGGRGRAAGFDRAHAGGQGAPRDRQRPKG